MKRLGIADCRGVLAALALMSCLLSPGTLQASEASEIDASVDTTLQAFSKEVKGADAYLKIATGVLVMPDVKKVGFVLGAQWGKGALLIDGKTAGYYRMDAGSAGFQAGYQKADFVFLFLTPEVLDEFRAGDGWTVGAEAGLTVVDASTPAMSADTLKAKSSVVAFGFGREGLMGGWSAKGTKFTRLDVGK